MSRRRPAAGPRRGDGNGKGDGGTPERHVPVRPGWTCAGCAADWPCPDRRGRLLVEYAGDRIALSMLLASYLSDAVADLPGTPPPELYRRFLGWPRRR
ncbi:flavin reductase [Micromonospora sp. WMMD882]|uniref:flavin reductase n=1 Tax=Micromonospora sp. WMMD882 TaxID=3015151 RepID=UPI00248B612A|nr:flavin reductase [Micromonospora sp. WMMD882]WBB78164.1 flavin reductase [Micromonospora sp. WMMD882]